MNIIEINAQADASAWTAIVQVSGVMYRAGFVANKLSCGLAPYKHAPHRPRWAEKSVQEWAKKQVAQLPAEWMAKHREMYA